MNVNANVVSVRDSHCASGNASDLVMELHFGSAPEREGDTVQIQDQMIVKISCYNVFG